MAGAIRTASIRAGCGCGPRSIPTQQALAQKALRNGLLRYDRGRGWTGPLEHVEIGSSWLQRAAQQQYRARLRGLARGDRDRRDGGDFAARLLRRHRPARCRAAPRRCRSAAAAARRSSAIKAGDIIAVAPEGGGFALRIDPQDFGRLRGRGTGDRPRAGDAGRVRQPRPVVQPRDAGDAPAGIDDQADRLCRRARRPGMTPASIIVDGPFCVYQGARLGQKCFRNFGGGGGSGPHTMRWGVEQSRNLMTVRAAAQTGHGQRRQADGPDRRRQIPALSVLLARRGRDDRVADGQRLCDPRQSTAAARPSTLDRFRPGPARQRDLAGELARRATAATRPTGTASRCRARSIRCKQMRRRR